MPDILIRGVEFPTMEQAYKTLIVSYDGKVYEGVHPQPTAKKKEPIAEAVELPPHGDLIDRDVLLNRIEAYVCGSQDSEFIKNEIIKDMPAVAPAERRDAHD